MATTQRLQQHDAAAASALARRANMLVRELRKTRVLTRAQRDSVLAAAATIPILPDGVVK